VDHPFLFRVFPNRCLCLSEGNFCKLNIVYDIVRCGRATRVFLSSVDCQLPGNTQIVNIRFMIIVERIYAGNELQEDGSVVCNRPTSLQFFQRLTKRAADGGDSARFMGIFHASSLYCSQV